MRHSEKTLEVDNTILKERTSKKRNIQIHIIVGQKELISVDLSLRKFKTSPKSQ